MKKYVMGILIVIIAAVLGFGSAYGAATVIHQQVVTHPNTQSTPPNQPPKYNRRLPFGRNAPGLPGDRFRRNSPGFKGRQGLGPDFPRFQGKQSLPGQRRPFNSPGSGRNNGNTQDSPSATPPPLPAK